MWYQIMFLEDCALGVQTCIAHHSSSLGLHSVGISDESTHRCEGSGTNIEIV